MKNIFKVPEGYFEALPTQIQARIAQENLIKISRENVFLVPQAYFEALPTYIQARVTRLEGNVFEVPTQYFEQLPLDIQQKILPTLPISNITKVLQTPEGYFENLQHHILRKVNEHKTKASKITVAFLFKTSWRVAFASLLLWLVWIGFRIGDRQENLPTIAEKQPAIEPKKTPKIEAIPEKAAQKTEAIVENTPQKVVQPIIETPIQPVIEKQENSLVQYLAKADEHTEEALSSLAEVEESMAGDGEEEEWHETHEETLHEISEEMIKTLPTLLTTNPKGKK
jgi:ABC-type multidrug transport system fused ATPase/permease subunit